MVSTSRNYTQDTKNFGMFLEAMFKKYEHIAVELLDESFVIVAPSVMMDPITEHYGAANEFGLEADIQGFAVEIYKNRTSANEMMGLPLDNHNLYNSNWNELATILQKYELDMFSNWEGYGEIVTPDVDGANGEMYVGSYTIKATMRVQEYGNPEQSTCKGYFGIDLRVFLDNDNCIFQEMISDQRIIDGLETGVSIVAAHQANGEDGVMAWMYEGIY